MSVGGDVGGRSFFRAAVPFSVPRKPLAIWFGPPFHQDRRSKLLCRSSPRFQLLVELAGGNIRQGKHFLPPILLCVRAQHETDERNFSKSANPATGDAR